MLTMHDAIATPRPLTVLPSPAGTPLPARGPSKWTAMSFAMLAAAVALLAWGHASESGTQFIRHFSTVFVSIVLEAMPFVMLGSIIGGIIEVFVSRERMAKLLPRRRSVSIFAAGGLGMLMPVCECAIIPVTRRLVRKGVPFSTAVAYLLAGPLVNPLVAASTAVAYAGDWRVVAIRLGFGYVIACTAALIIDRIFPGDRALRADFARADDSCAHDCGHDHSHDHTHDHAKRAPFGTRCLAVLRHASDDFVVVGQFLVMGAFIAGLLQTTAVRQMLLDLGQNPGAAIAAMMTLAVLLNLCSEADAFVAASFRMVLPLSAQMAFMVLGPMLDLKLVAMYLSFVRVRPLIVLIVLLCVLVFAAMWLSHGWMEGVSL
jgi:uncharacterized membrane protein YraQ (UPF0718 family)